MTTGLIPAIEAADGSRITQTFASGKKIVE
jgi:hypothetical protein